MPPTHKRNKKIKIINIKKYFIYQRMKNLEKRSEEFSEIKTHVISAKFD